MISDFMKHPFHTNSSYDCIIVGAGPIGCILAVNLHQQGLRVLILEKNDWQKIHSPYLNGVSEHFLPLLSKLNLLDMILKAKINDGKQVILMPPGGQRLQGEWEEHKRRIFFVREEFDQALRQCVKQEQIDFLDQVRAIVPIQKEGKVIGIQGKVHQNSYQFFSKIVFGCDGAHSRFAKAVGLESAPATFHHLYQGRMYADTAFHGHVTTLFPHCKPGQLLLVFSADHIQAGHAYVELETDLKQTPMDTVHDRRNLEAVFQKFLSQSPEFAQAMRYATPLGDWKMVSSSGTSRSQIQRPGVIFLGDAASCVDALGSSGLLLGLQGIEEILEIVKDRPPEEWNFCQWEQNYLRRVHNLQHFIKMLRFILNHPKLLHHIVNLLNKTPLHKQSFFEVFNGIQSYSEFLAWPHQLQFWLSAYLSRILGSPRKY